MGSMGSHETKASGKTTSDGGKSQIFIKVRHICTLSLNALVIISLYIISRHLKIKGEWNKNVK